MVQTEKAEMEEAEGKIRGDKNAYLGKEEKRKAFSDKGRGVTAVVVPSELQDKSGNQQKKSN